MPKFTRLSPAAAWIIPCGILVLVAAVPHRFTSANGELNEPGYTVQLTATAQPPDISEIGSTDGIVVLGLLIGLIVITPILVQRKTWSKN